MARDVAINSNRRTEYNIRGDIANARGDDFLTDRIFIGINETVDMSPPELTDVQIEEQRGDIERAVVRNPFTEQPISVTVENIDYEEQSIQYSIETEQIETVVTTE